MRQPQFWSYTREDIRRFTDLSEEAFAKHVERHNLEMDRLDSIFRFLCAFGKEPLRAEGSAILLGYRVPPVKGRRTLPRPLKRKGTRHKAGKKAK